jgi:hypothetical protein
MKTILDLILIAPASMREQAQTNGQIELPNNFQVSYGHSRLFQTSKILSSKY